ncbi:MAG: glyoxylate/hydroxypyruvate reductase A [Pseudomonadota bacterium]
MALLFVSEADPARDWRRALAERKPGLDIRVYPEIGTPEDIRYALVWYPPLGLLADLPNLDVIFSLGAGVDGVLKDEAVPKDKPLVRMVSEGLTQDMVEYVICHVLRRHCGVERQAAQQARRDWVPQRRVPAAETTVGILGLGVLGAATAQALVPFGFHVRGWSRRPKSIPGVQSFAGTEKLNEFLAGCDILACLLPLTPDTEGILSSETFAALPKGAYLINAARGGHLVEDDLIPAMEGGCLSGATLDVFRTEPLPSDHPFWTHPSITITPHDASMTPVESGARHVVRQIERYENGEPLEHLVERSRGY